MALAEGYHRPGAAFGRDLARDLRSLIEKVAAGGKRHFRGGGCSRRLKWNCQCNQYEVEEKVRALAREILNDWDAVIAFVHNPSLPPTNNDAERALRHAVIARRIGFGTRTDEAQPMLWQVDVYVMNCAERPQYRRRLRRRQRQNGGAASFADAGAALLRPGLINGLSGKVCTTEGDWTGGRLRSVAVAGAAN